MEKKTKLTISGNPKKSFKNFGVEKTQGKKTVIIGKNSERPSGKSSFNKSFGNKPRINNFKYNPGSKANLQNKTSFSVTDFEKRKLAEQRATKKLKSELDGDKKSKIGVKKKTSQTYSF